MCFATKITTYDHAGAPGLGGSYRDRPELPEQCPICQASRGEGIRAQYFTCGGGYRSEYLSLSWGQDYYSHDFFFCPFERQGEELLPPVFSYEQFLDWNTSYFRKADQTDYHVALTHALAIMADQRATSEPVNGSRVIASGWDNYREKPSLYHYAQLEVDSDGDITVCTQPAGPWVGIRNNGTTYTSTSGGYFVHAKREDLVRLSIQLPKQFWTWGSNGSGPSHGIYFTIPVPVWVYHNEHNIY